MGNEIASLQKKQTEINEGYDTVDQLNQAYASAETGNAPFQCVVAKLDSRFVEVMGYIDDAVARQTDTINFAT